MSVYKGPALWLAGEGHPDPGLFVVFVLGVVVSLSFVFVVLVLGPRVVSPVVDVVLVRDLADDQFHGATGYRDAAAAHGASL